MPRIPKRPPQFIINAAAEKKLLRVPIVQLRGRGGDDLRRMLILVDHKGKPHFTMLSNGNVMEIRPDPQWPMWEHSKGNTTPRARHYKGHQS